VSLPEHRYSLCKTASFRRSYPRLRPEELNGQADG